MIINAGITMVYYEEGYPDPLSDQMLAEADIETVRLSL
jgi:dCMP deaminase